MKSTSSRRLVLHFNIDKTIVGRDVYNGLDTIPLTLADGIARMAWGQVTIEDDRRKWTLVYEQFSPEQPEEDLMSYYQFLDLEYSPRTQLEEGETPEELAEYNKEISKTRREKLLVFAKAGQPGAKFKSQVDKINRAAYLPKNVREDLGLNDLGHGKKDDDKQDGEGEDIENEDHGEGEEPEEENEEETDEQKMLKLFEDQKYHLLPAFFKTLIYLKKAKREFAIVIRGEDEFIKPVIFEFNKFGIGEHPCFGGRSGTPTIKFDGSKNTKYGIIDEKCKANFYRFPNDKNCMVFGALEPEKLDDINKPEDMEEAFNDEIDSGKRIVATDSVQCYVELMELFKRYGAVAIREDKDQKRILYVDPADYNTQHIFFDAKGGLGSNCRISVRDIISNKEIPFRNVINKNIALVEPHRAVSEPDYFMKLIEMGEYTFDKEMSAREAGKIPSDILDVSHHEVIQEAPVNREEGEGEVENENIATLSEWEKLQQLPHDQYLTRTIMPVLYQGLKLVATERPEFPIKSLAMFILKNQDKVKLPSK